MGTEPITAGNRTALRDTPFSGGHALLKERCKLALEQGNLSAANCAALLDADSGALDLIFDREFVAAAADTLIKAVEQRPSYESVRDVCEKILSGKGLRNIERSIVRNGPRNVTNNAPDGSGWKKRLMQVACNIRWAGVGRDGEHDNESVARKLAAESGAVEKLSPECTLEKLLTLLYVGNQLGISAVLPPRESLVSASWLPGAMAGALPEQRGFQQVNAALTRSPTVASREVVLTRYCSLLSNLFTNRDVALTYLEQYFSFFAVIDQDLIDDALDMGSEELGAAWSKANSELMAMYAPSTPRPVPIADPELQAFLDSQTPVLRSHDASMQQEMLDYLRSQLQVSMVNLNPEQQRTYVAAYQNASAAMSALEAAVAATKNDFERDGLATLSGSIKSATGKEVDPKTTYTHTRFVEQPARHRRALDPRAPREHIQTMSLWDAACMNVGFDANLPTRASGFSYSEASWIDTDPNGSDVRSARTSWFAVAAFVKIVRDANLGQALDNKLHRLLDSDGPLSQLLQKAAHTQWDFDVLEAYRDGGQSGVTQKPFDALQQALQGAPGNITIQPYTLHFTGVTWPHEEIIESEKKSSVAVPLFLIRLRGDLSVFSYFPGRPGGALRYHASPQAALTAFQEQLTQQDGNSELSWFTRQLPQAKLVQFMEIAKDRSHLGPAPAGKAPDAWWERPGHYAGEWLQEQFRSSTSRLSKVRLVPEAIPGNPRSQPDAPAEALHARLAARYRADLNLLATPKSASDWQAIRNIAVSVAQETLELLLTPAPGGVTGLNKIIQAATLGSLAYSSVGGAMAAASGNPAEFAAAFSDLLDMAISERLNIVAGKLGHRRTQQLIAQLGRPVTLPNGEKTLWRPDLQPYTARDQVRLDGLTPNAQGIFEQNGKQYIRLSDGQQQRVAELSYDTQRRRHVLAHPDPAVFKPPLAYDPNSKLWTVALDDGSTLTDAALLMKMQPAAFNGEQQAAQLLAATATSRATLDGMWAGKAVPASFADGLARVQADRFIQQMIVRLPERGYMPADGDSIVLALLTQLPGWPRDTSLDVHDAEGTRIATYTATGNGNLPRSVALQRRSNGEYVAKGDLTAGASNQEQMLQLILQQLPAGSDLGKGGDFEGSATDAGRIVVIREQIAKLADSERAGLFDAVLTLARHPGSIKSGNTPVARFLPVWRRQVPSELPPWFVKLQKADPALSNAALVELLRQHPLSTDQKNTLLAKGTIPPALRNAMLQAKGRQRLDLALDAVYHTRTFNADSDALARELAGALLQVRLNRRFVVLEATDPPYIPSGPDDTTVVLLHAGGGNYKASDLRNGGEIPVRQGSDGFYQAIGSVLQPHERRALGMNGETDMAGLRTTLGYLAANNRAIFQPGVPGSSGKQNRIARLRLDTIVANAGKDKNTLDAGEKELASAALMQLMTTSKAESQPTITWYAEAGSGEINGPLQSGQGTPEVQAFLAELDIMSEYTGLAYRSAYVTPAAALALKNGAGKVFADRGVQSASTLQINAEDWQVRGKATAPVQAQQRVLFVFDPSVPKKNIATGVLADHVAIAPDAPLQVLATASKAETLYVYLATPDQVPKAGYKLFDGSAVPDLKSNAAAGIRSGMPDLAGYESKVDPRTLHPGPQENIHVDSRQTEYLRIDGKWYRSTIKQDGKRHILRPDNWSDSFEVRQVGKQWQPVARPGLRGGMPATRTAGDILQELYPGTTKDEVRSHLNIYQFPPGMQDSYELSLALYLEQEGKIPQWAIKYLLLPAPIVPGRATGAAESYTIYELPRAIADMLLLEGKTPSDLPLPAFKVFIDQRKQISSHADRFYRTNVIPPRPMMPVLDAAASPQAFIGGVYKRSHGMVVGEAHEALASKQFLIDNMGNFVKEKVKTLYMEHLLTNSHQADLDTFFTTGRMPDTLQLYLQALDCHFHFDPGQKYTFYNLVKTAGEHGIHIIAIDAVVAHAFPEMHYLQNNRIKMMNYFSSKVIEADQRAKGTHRWVALVGTMHMNRYTGIDGIAELLGAIGVRVESVSHGAPTGVMADRGGRLDTASGPQILKGDFKMEIGVPDPLAGVGI